MRMTRAKWLGAAAIVVAALVAGAGVPRAGSEEPDSSDRAAEKAGPDLTEIRSRARSMPLDRRIDIDKRIGATVDRVDKQAADRGQVAVAKRLAAEFGYSGEALADEKGRHGLSWGEMMIALTLMSNTKGKVTLSDLVTLRSEGLTWGAIAFGLRFRLEDFEDAIKSQGKVAMGLERADGKAAVIGK